MKIGDVTAPLADVLLTNLTNNYGPITLKTNEYGEDTKGGLHNCSDMRFRVERDGFKTIESPPKHLESGDNKLEITLGNEDCKTEETTTVHGTITAKAGDLLKGPLEDAKVTLASFDDSSRTSGYTNGEGYFELDEISPCTVVRLEAKKDGMKTAASPWTIILSGKNEINLEVLYEGTNVLTGKATDDKGVPQEGLSVTAMSHDRNPPDYYSDVTDEDGNFVIPAVPPGSFVIKVKLTSNKNDLQTIPKEITASFTQPQGQVIKRDFKVILPKGPFKIRVVAVEGTVQNSPMSFGGLPIPEAKITVTAEGNGESEVPAGTNSKDSFWHTYILDNGKYTVTAEKEEYTTDTLTFTVRNSDKDILLVLGRSNVTCKRKPQTTVEAFWFCGKAAIALSENKLFDNRWATIDGSVNALRNRYGYKALPLQVIILDSSIGNGGYDTIKGCPGLSIPLDKAVAPEPTERIVYTTGIVQNVTLTELAHVTAHEWGHGKDWREGKCEELRSHQEDFIDLMEKATRKGILLLKDGDYDPSLPSAGHPDDGPSETYASAFHDWYLHPQTVETRIKTLAESARIALQAIGRITQTPEGITQ